MNDATQLRIIIAAFGALLLIGMYLFGRPKKPPQGTRTARRTAPDGSRSEPTLGDTDHALDDGLDPELADELERLGGEIARSREPAPEMDFTPARAPVGVRTDQAIDRIVTLYVSARPGETIGGPELVVAAEKAGPRVRRTARSSIGSSKAGPKRARFSASRTW
jgi:cell division protein ZipA